MSAIRLENLSFRYPGSGTDTLTGLNLQVGRGEAHALLGGSGAGKTTLLNLLSGLLQSAPGTIFFDDQDVGGVAPWRRRVSQVFQFPVLYEGMTVRENLAFPIRELSGRERERRVEDIAGRLGIAGVLSQHPAKLTLVQKQLAAIGKALVRPDVSLVLLDEPLTAAQPEYKWQLRQTLKSLQRELGATMIYVTHDQTEALTFADRVSVLHEGRILQTDTPRMLVESPAHEHVGYFVGSPGMNLLDAEIRDGHCRLAGRTLREAGATDGSCRVGFRPDWAAISPDDGGGIPVDVLGTRTLTTERGMPVGLVTGELDGQTVVTHQSLAGVVPGRGRLEIDAGRLVLFRDGARILP